MGSVEQGAQRLRTISPPDPEAPHPQTALATRSGIQGDTVFRRLLAVFAGMIVAIIVLMLDPPRCPVEYGLADVRPRLRHRHELGPAA